MGKDIWSWLVGSEVYIVVILHVIVPGNRGKALVFSRLREQVLSVTKRTRRSQT